MRPKSIVLLFLALGCGLVASIGISQVMDKNRNQTTQGIETEAIYVAKIDINLGDPIKPEMVNLEEWPQDKIPPGAMSKLEDVEGRRPKSKIYAGAVIQENQLLDKGFSVGATEDIPVGYRVVSVMVNDDGGASDRRDDRCNNRRRCGLP